MPSLEVVGGMEDISAPPEWLLTQLNQRAAKANGRAPGVGNRHDSLVSMAGKLRHADLTGDALLSALTAYNLTFPEPQDEADVRRIATDYSAKPRVPGGEPDKEPPPPLFDSSRAPIGMQTFTEPQSLPEMIVEGILPNDIGMKAGAGGASKTSLTVWEGVHIILGKQLYGRDVLRPGNIVAVTGEDSTRRYRYRIRQICDCIPNLTAAHKEHIAQSFMVEDLVGKGVRLVQVDMDGNLMQTGVVDALIDAYINANVSLVTVDPYVFFGPGERFVNDAESAMAQAAHRISTNLNCAVQYIHHTGKANFREGRTDQYSGRGGSALPDGMRYVHVLARHEKSHEAMPSQFTPEDIVNGRVLSLHVPKITDAPPISEPIWIRRTGWRFEHVIARPEGQQDLQRDRLRTLWAFVDAQAVLGIRHTGRSLEDASKEIGIGRNEIRTAVHVALELKHLVEVKLPKAEQHGRRQTYLAKGLEP